MLVQSGTLTFTIPYYLNTSGNTVTKEQGYENDLDYTAYTGDTNFTGITYYNAIGLSKLSEYQKYGGGGHTISLDVVDNITGYTIDDIHYRDYPEGYTVLTGNTVGFTKEEVIFEVLSRNEHFLGFIEEPTIYSDVFVERGKQGVMEMNLRLGEVENMGELSVYGNGYFKVKKQ
jgi:hypothetical protein